MTGSAYLGALLPVTSSWAVAPMAGQFALRGQSGAPRRLSAPVFLNGGGGEGVRAFSPLPRMGAMQSCTHRHVPAVLSRRLPLPARQGISKVLPRSCHAVPFSSARTAEYDHKSPRGYSDDITGPLSRIAQSSLCSARTVWLPSAETWSKANSPWQLENKRFSVA